MQPDELEQLSRLVGAPLLSAEHARWGFTNRTDIVTLAGGQQLVVQRLLSPQRASEVLRLGRLLPAALAAIGIRLPHQLAADPHATPPYAVREFIPGTAGAAFTGSDSGIQAVAAAMGALLPALASLPATALALDTTWASVDSLVVAARGWLAHLQPQLEAPAIQILEATIASLPPLLHGPATFAHGDYCPVNALFAETSTPLKLVALLDVEHARLALPPFDAAWWGWVVRFHHPARWPAAQRALLTAAGLPDSADTAARFRAIQQLRCLELAAAATREPTSVAWVERLAATLAWPA